MGISNVFSLVCGMVMFLFGMSLMGDGLKRTAGGKFELLLARLTDTPVKGVLLGTGVTAIIQSSSATSVMAVGFVNSGMMKFRQSIPIVLGSILGTSITGWIICLSELGGGDGWVQLLSSATITGIVALGSILVRKFAEGYDYVADIMMGFVVLMVGISSMSGAVAPLQQSEAFIHMLTLFSDPLIGILVGALFTAVLQSASAAVGILQALTVTGAIDFSTALPIILGISIGAAGPVLLSAISANVNGKRTSFVYLFISVLGVLLCGGVFYALNLFLSFPVMGMTMSAVSVAAVNTLFRLLNVVVLYPFIGLIDRMTCLWIKDKTAANESPDDAMEPIALDERFLNYPALALAQVQRAVYDMAHAVHKSVILSFSVMDDFTEEQFAKVAKCEKLADHYEDSIGTYLMKLSKIELTKEQSADVFKYLHTLSYFERITDQAMIVAYTAKEKYDKDITYSADAQRELDALQGAVSEIVRITVDDFISNRWQVDGRVSALSMVIRAMCDKAELHHVERLQAGSCTLVQGTGFNELLTDFERIASHCTKVVLAMVEAHDVSYNIHVDNLSLDLKDSDTARQLEEYRAKYSV